MNPASSNEIASSIPNLVEVSKAQRNARLEWVDYAKGIAILLVVYGHVLIGTYNARLNISYFVYIYSLKFMYTFHMPVFFFLAGMFVDRGRSSSFSQFLSKKINTIVYPYLIWSVIQGSIYALMSPYTNFKFNITELPVAIAFEPLIQLWFLYVLFVYHMVFISIKKLLRSVFYITVPLAIFTYFISYYVDDSLFDKILKFFIFYVLGAVSAKLLLEKDWMPLTGLQVILFSIFFIILQSMFLQLDGPIDVTGGPIKSFLMACSGIVFIICLSFYLSKNKIASYLKYIGILSMPIYLVHILSAVGTRIVLQKGLDINDPIVHIIIGTAAGLALPIVLYLSTQKLKFPYLFSINNR